MVYILCIMFEILGGIFIGIGIETFCLASYIYFKKRQLKPHISYTDAVPTNEQLCSIEYNDL